MASTDIKKAYVRLAKPEEFDKISEISQMAFVQDPVFNYFGSVKDMMSNDTDSTGRRHLYNWSRFLIRACSLAGGRITVVVIPDDSGEETIAAAAYWLPPHKRLALWKVVTLLRAGLISVLAGWGWNGLMRAGVEYGDVTHSTMDRSFKSSGIRKSSDASWYLQLALTHPDHQGQGLMSLLIREGYAHAPDSIFTLEATTSKSKDQYAHLGFELLDEVKFGKGKVGKDGLPVPSKNDAGGVACFIMAKWTKKP